MPEDVLWITAETNSVPKPRTCRTMSPRRTVSGRMVERSMEGTAGFNLPIATVAPAASGHRNGTEQRPANGSFAAHPLPLNIHGCFFR